MVVLVQISFLKNILVLAQLLITLHLKMSVEIVMCEHLNIKGLIGLYPL